MTGYLSRLADTLESISSNYALRFGIERSRDWFALKLQEEMGEAVGAWLRLSGRSRHRAGEEDARRQLADELTDVIGHALLFARNEGIDLDEAFARKWLQHLPADAPAAGPAG